ncbi:hypothetical protein B0H19DRAFT_1137660 [Mycena capillaripes]|nr:hypothetical protein B0H19DRAFT_1137660 [Mycena capillaripes]
MTNFLDLPPELILRCLIHLSLTDLDSCLDCGNCLLREIILISVLITYRREQDSAGIEENSGVTSSSLISDGLEALRRREANWLNFTPSSGHTITNDFETTGVHDLASDVYIVGDTAHPNALCTAIQLWTAGVASHRCWEAYQRLWHAVQEHDLTAFVT